MIEIIPAREEHVSAIVGLWHEMMAFHVRLNPFYSLAGDARERAEEFLRANIASPDLLVLVTLDGQTVVAFCLCFIAAHPPVFPVREYGLISDFAVTERYRRRGIGTIMLSRVREWFADRGIDRIELRVSTFNAVGRPFWEKQGFAEYEALTCFEGQ
jgi:GNAT superfamily N-acetyltransferase